MQMNKSSTSTSPSTTNTKYKIFCDLDGVLVDFDKGVLDLFQNSSSSYKSTSSIPDYMLWSKINSSPSFFRDLHWMGDGSTLWKILMQLYFHEDHVDGLHILTGCPRSKKSIAQKYEWCQHNLDLDISDIGENSVEKTAKNTDDVRLKLVHVNKASMKRGSKHEVVNLKEAHLSEQVPENQRRVDVITCWSKNKHYESRMNHILIDDRLKFKEDWTAKGGIFIHHTSTSDTIRQLIQCGVISESHKYDLSKIKDISMDTDMDTDQKYSTNNSSKKRGATDHLENDKDTTPQPPTKKQKKQIDTQSPLMILLLGIPGAGKSYFAQSLTTTNPDKYVRICQDIMKTRKKCETKCREALSKGKIPIIDRTNYNAEQRKHFIDIAKKEFGDCPIDIIHFDYDKDICVERCEKRPNHETLSNDRPKKIRTVVARMNGMLRVPDKSEAELFRNFEVVRSFEESNLLLSSYSEKIDM